MTQRLDADIVPIAGLDTKNKRHLLVLVKGFAELFLGGMSVQLGLDRKDPLSGTDGVGYGTAKIEMSRFEQNEQIMRCAHYSSNRLALYHIMKGGLFVATQNPSIVTACGIGCRRHVARFKARSS